MIAAILSIAATGVHVALRSAVVASTVRALNAASTTLNHYESLLYRRHDDDVSVQALPDYGDISYA